MAHFKDGSLFQTIHIQYLGDPRSICEVLLTTFNFVQQPLKARPLNSVTAYTADFVAITPNHFRSDHCSASLLAVTSHRDIDNLKKYVKAQAK